MPCLIRCHQEEAVRLVPLTRKTSSNPFPIFPHLTCLELKSREKFVADIVDSGGDGDGLSAGSVIRV